MGKFMDKAWGLLILVLVVIYAVFLGEDIGSNDKKDIIVDSVLLVFWLALLVWFHFMRLRDQRLDFEIDQSKKDLEKATKKLFDEILDHAGSHKHNHVVKTGKPESPLHDALTDQFVAILGEVTDTATPTAQELAEVKKRFEAKTGHEVLAKINGHGLTVEISKEPMAKKKPARVRKPVAKKATVQPASKSQERRMAAMKKAPAVKKPIIKKGN